MEWERSLKRIETRSFWGELQMKEQGESFCGGSTLHTLTRPLFVARSRQVMHTLIVEELLIL
jgi:hypothetical protein